MQHLYNGDITRTFPINGRFSGEQRALYELVLAAQEAAVAAVRPGATAEAIHDIARTHPGGGPAGPGPAQRLDRWR